MPDVFGVGKGEGNIDDAAARALLALAFSDQAGDFEKIGMLFRDHRDNQIYRTPTQTQYQQGTSEFHGTVYGQPQALFHNHPYPQPTDRAPQTRFSYTDATTGQNNQEPSYLIAPERGVPPIMQLENARKLPPVPKDVKINQAQAEQQGVAGEKFLAQIPMDLYLKLLARDNPLLDSLLRARQQNPSLGAPFVGPLQRGEKNGNSNAR